MSPLIKIKTIKITDPNHHLIIIKNLWIFIVKALPIKENKMFVPIPVSLKTPIKSNSKSLPNKKTIPSNRDKVLLIIK